jgi:hypothetical protein
LSSELSDSKTYKPIIEFTTHEGVLIEFTTSYLSNPPAFNRGEIIEVVYPGSSPEMAKSNTFFSLWGGQLILACIGTVLFIIGFDIVIGRLGRKNVQYLKENGIPITSKFQSVKENESLTVNGCIRIKSLLSDRTQKKNSEIHVFSSENIWFDPSEYIKCNDITVMIERDKPQKYYVDISFLPRLAD